MDNPIQILNDLVTSLEAKSAGAEQSRQAETNEFRERIWLGMREGYDDAIRLGQKAIAQLSNERKGD